jgi:hypothetical protein
MVVTYIIPDFIPLMITLDGLFEIGALRLVILLRIVEIPGKFSDSNMTIEIDYLSRVMITVDLTERQILRYAEN